MGANAQTSVPTFTAGEVLTAANMNISARTGVPVFADTTARDAAFGGTGEKTLAEGQMAYVENLTGDQQIQYYDGSTWNSLGAAGLTLVTSQTIGTAVSSITVSNCFSATYDNYRVIVSGGAGTTTTGLSLRVGAAATAYAYVMFQNNYNGTAANDNSTNATSYAPAGGVTTNSSSLVCDILSPFLTENTIFLSNRAIPDTASVAGAGAGFLNNTTSYTDLTVLVGSGTMTGGTIKVYGYRN